MEQEIKIEQALFYKYNVEGELFNKDIPVCSDMTICSELLIVNDL